MRKFIKSVILFSLFSFCFYIMLTLVAGNFFPELLRGNILTENRISAYDASDVRYGHINSLKPVDVLILGSSHAYRGYDVRIFDKNNFHAYNLGSSSQTLALTKFIYEKYIDIFKPRKLIIDIYPVILEKKSSEGALNILPIFYNQTLFVKNLLRDFDIRVINSVLYFQIFGDTEKIKSTLSKDDHYINGGYISTNRTTTNKGKNNYKPAVLKINKENIEALKDIVFDAEKRGIQVYLFQAPLPEERYKSFTNNKEIDSLMNSLGHYYNYNNERFLPVEYFFDDSRINQKGVDIYNKWVLEKINEK